MFRNIRAYFCRRQWTHRVFSIESPRQDKYEMKCMGNIREQFLMILSDLIKTTLQF